MSLRKNFDSFTPQQKLRDAEEAYVQAVYRFRAAEDEYEQNVSDLKREMNFLFRKVGHYRHCLHTGKPLEEYLEYSAASAEARCSKPAWV
jgi:muconolactone delta-isomerase